MTHAAELITQSEAARRLATDRKQIQRWLDSGKLDVATTADGLRLVTIKSVERLRVERGR